MITCLHDLGQQLNAAVHRDVGPADITRTISADELEATFQSIREATTFSRVDVKANELWKLEVAAIRSVLCLYSSVKPGAEFATGQINLHVQ